jgi:hypothetical protein
MYKIRKGLLVKKDKLTDSQKEIYLVEIKGVGYGSLDNLEKPVPLKKSRLVKLEPKLRLNKKTGKMEERPVGVPDTQIYRSEKYSTRHLTKSAKVNPKSDGVLQKGIQLYRLWFRFLKLALELEELGVDRFVTSNTRDMKRSGTEGGTSYKDGDYGGGNWQIRDTVKFKVDRGKYKGWDLDQVLNDTFDKWWKTHYHLFEGYAPILTKPNDNQNSDDFLYIRVDKSSNVTDLRDFISTEVVPILQKGKPKFEISGNPRPDKIQNTYNALVFSLNPVVDGVVTNAEGFCTHKNIYLRATDSRSGSDRLMVNPHTDKNGRTRTHWSGMISRQREVGVHHLLNVMSGELGKSPDK